MHATHEARAPLPRPQGGTAGARLRRRPRERHRPMQAVVTHKVAPMTDRRVRLWRYCPCASLHSPDPGGRGRDDESGPFVVVVRGSVSGPLFGTHCFRRSDEKAGGGGYRALSPPPPPSLGHPITSSSAACMQVASAKAHCLPRGNAPHGSAADMWSYCQVPRTYSGNIIRTRQPFRYPLVLHTVQPRSCRRLTSPSISTSRTCRIIDALLFFFVFTARPLLSAIH